MSFIGPIHPRDPDRVLGADPDLLGGGSLSLGPFFSPATSYFLISNVLGVSAMLWHCSPSAVGDGP